MYCEAAPCFAAQCLVVHAFPVLTIIGCRSRLLGIGSLAAMSHLSDIGDLTVTGTMRPEAVLGPSRKRTKPMVYLDRRTISARYCSNPKERYSSSDIGVEPSPMVRMPIFSAWASKRRTRSVAMPRRRQSGCVQTLTTRPLTGLGSPRVGPHSINSIPAPAMTSCPSSATRPR
jgi:hypothetical protein